MINIYVGNLPYSTSESDLETLFSQFGPVAKASIIMDRETGRSRGFGFVEMPNPEEGRRAIEALAGQPYLGRNLTINEARPREPRRGGSAYSRPTGGGYSGNDAGNGYSGGAGRPSRPSGGYASTPVSDDDSASTGYSGGYSNQRQGG